MSTLRKQEAAGPGLKRIACEQVESAIRCLTRQAGQGTAAAEAIHQVQAVLAMIEPDLPRPTVRRDRAILLRLSEGLAELSEPTMLADRLGKRYKKNPSDAALASAVKTLRRRWSSGSKSGSAMNNKAGGFNPVIYRLVADMAELRGHVGDWPTDGIANDQPPRGLRRSYAKARKLANEPIAASTLPALVEALSELTTQLSVINKTCPTMLKAQRKLLKRIADELNELIANDQLDAALRSELGKGEGKLLPSKKPLAKRFAETVGSDLETALAETPAAFIRRTQTYWTAWRGGSD